MGHDPLETFRYVLSDTALYRFDELDVVRDYQVNVALYQEDTVNRQQTVVFDGIEGGVSLEARDGDDSPASTTDTNTGSYCGVSIDDEDTEPPTFSNPAPAEINVGETLTFTIAINDPSGIHDTAASDLSVYLEWDTGGEFDVDVNSLDMDLLSGDTWQADTPVGPFPGGGAVVSWRAYAEDNDDSRAGAWSEVYAVNVAIEYYIYLPVVVRE